MWKKTSLCVAFNVEYGRERIGAAANRVKWIDDRINRNELYEWRENLNVYDGCVTWWQGMCITYAKCLPLFFTRQKKSEKVF